MRWFKRYKNIDENIEEVVQTQEEKELNKRGVEMATESRFEEAKEIFLYLINQNPENPSYYSNLGNIYYEQNDYKKAIELYEISLSKNPEHLNSMNNMAAAYKKIGDYESYYKIMKMHNKKTREKWRKQIKEKIL